MLEEVRSLKVDDGNRAKPLPFVKLTKAVKNPIMGVGVYDFVA